MSAPPPPTSLPTAQRVLLAVLAMLVLVFLTVSVVSAVGGLPSVELRLRPAWLAVSALLFLIGQLMHAELWRRILADAGGHVDPVRGLWIFSASLLARYVPTQVLMVVTRVGLAERAGVARSVALTSVVYEFALVVGTSIALSLGYLLSLDRVQGSPLRFLLVLAPVALLALLHPRVIDLLFDRLGGRMGIRSAHETLRVRSLALYAAGYALSFVVLGLAVAAFAAGVRPLDGIGPAVLASYAVGYAATVLAFVVPGGLGAREGAMASALSAVMPLSAGLAVAIGVRILQTGVELAWAGAGGLAVRRRGRRDGAHLE